MYVGFSECVFLSRAGGGGGCIKASLRHELQDQQHKQDVVVHRSHAVTVKILWLCLIVISKGNLLINPFFNLLELSLKLGAAGKTEKTQYRELTNNFALISLQL